MRIIAKGPARARRASSTSRSEPERRAPKWTRGPEIMMRHIRAMTGHSTLEVPTPGRYGFFEALSANLDVTVRGAALDLVDRARHFLCRAVLALLVAVAYDNGQNFDFPWGRNGNLPRLRLGGVSSGESVHHVIIVERQKLDLSGSVQSLNERPDLAGLHLEFERELQEIVAATTFRREQLEQENLQLGGSRGVRRIFLGVAHLLDEFQYVANSRLSANAKAVITKALLLEQRHDAIACAPLLRFDQIYSMLGRAFEERVLIAPVDQLRCATRQNDHVLRVQVAMVQTGIVHRLNASKDPHRNHQNLVARVLARAPLQQDLAHEQLHHNCRLNKPRYRMAKPSGSMNHAK